MQVGKKFTWDIREVDDAIVRDIAYTHHLSLPIAHILAVRGLTKPEDVRAFLFTSFEQDVPDARHLKDSDIVIERLLRAIKYHEKILIFGDYDVDGITACSIALTALLPLGAQVNFYLPNRIKDGYGLSPVAVKKAAENGFNLIITVDNGITAFEAAKEAQSRGVDLIITDHHRPDGDMPPAMAIVDPHRPDCPYPFKHLAGVGVIFKLMCLLYTRLEKVIPDKMYELMLLGTVADVVPLIGENRFWVRHGLAKVNQRRSTALSTLALNNNVTKDALNSLDIGFMIAPQLNALGRLSDPREGVKFLIGSDTADTERIGAILKKLNEERKEIEQKIYGDIDRTIARKKIDIEKERIIIAGNANWPSGVIGLVAGKLTHAYGRPTILFHLDHNAGIAKGSCRSIQEFNIFNALSRHKDLLESFGGHACAAGLKLSIDNIEKLKERLEADLSEIFTIEQLRPHIIIDAPLQLGEMTGTLISNLDHLEPFGNQNPQPLFKISQVTQLKSPQIFKEKHVKCTIFADGIIKPVIFFNRPDILPILESLGDQPFDLAAHVFKNEWEGKVKIELQGIDISV